MTDDTATDERPPTHAWRVWMTGPNGAACEQFPTWQAAQDYATGVRGRHPTWEVEISEWHIPGYAR